MSVFRNDHDSYAEYLPRRQYAADHGRRSPSPPPAPTNPFLEPGAQENEAVGPQSTIKDPSRAADSLLDHPEDNTRPIPASLTSSGPRYQKRKVAVSQGFMKRLLPGLVRCVISWLLIAAFYISLWKYKDRVISPRTKSGFDAITVALSIAFGLNIASSLKGVALDLRWWVLGMKKRSSREVELILHCDSMTELLRLVYVARRPVTVLACLFWLALNILAQTGIAVLGLTYSAYPGIEDIYRAPGMNNVSIPNMTHFASRTGRFSNLGLVEFFAAHVLGDIGSSYNFSMLPEHALKDMPWASNPAAFWNGTDHWEYTFLDSAPVLGASGLSTLSIYTDRIVKSTAICETPPYQITINGDLAFINLLNGGQTIIFPTIALGLESIYYLTTPTQGQEGNSAGCCSGCSNVKVLEPAAGPPVPGSFVAGSNSSYFYYDCNITVASTNQEVSPLSGAIAAQAIALSGQIHQELKNTEHGNNEYVSYNFGLPFGETQNNSATGMANLVSRFAIGVIAAAAQTNPSIIIQGGQPTQGVRLQLDSPTAFNLILGLAGLLQLVLVIFTALVVGRLEIPEEALLSHEGEILKQFVLDS